MKKSLIIALGATIVIALIAVWAYLFVNGTPETADDVFADLGLAGDNEVYVPTQTNNTDTTPTSTINMERNQLKQLTTRPVAGYTDFITGTAPTTVIYYTEAGTGHIYSINADSGEESRVSGTTVAQANKAAISKDGNYAAIASLNNNKTYSLVSGRISTSSNSLLEDFTDTVSDFAFTDDNQLIFIKTDNQGMTGYSYDFSDESQTKIFSLPFVEVTMVWGKKSSGPHYAYPKTAHNLEGFLLSIENGQIERLPVSGFAFAAKANQDFILYNSRQNNQLTSFFYDRQTEETRTLDAPITPEKCYLLDQGYVFFCAHQAIVLPYEYPDIWYAGELQFSDTLYALSASDMNSERYVDIKDKSGREVDVIKLNLSTSGNELLFINKNDSTLWMYEI